MCIIDKCNYCLVCLKQQRSLGFLKLQICENLFPGCFLGPKMYIIFLLKLFLSN